MGNDESDRVSRTAHRKDIQGLRAIAVIAVILYHAGFPIPGGFTGVDVFFVISGFVITHSLFRAASQQGRVDLWDFFWRRFRRLAPALGLVVLTSTIAAVLVIDPFTVQPIAHATAIGASFGVANVVIALRTGDYFDLPADFNPLLHTWSLSVEEQFYIFLSLAFVLVLKNSRSTQRGLSLLLKVFAVSALVSFLLAIGFQFGYEPLDNRTVFGFYSPIVRVWEFLSGAILALLDQRRFPAPGARLLQALGALFIGTGFFVVSPQSVPGNGALLPVLGTVLLILGGSTAATTGKILSSKFLSAIGDRSYSLYLWHWPLIVFANYLQPGDFWIQTSALLVSFAAAIAAYRYVENPMRRRPISTTRSRIGFVGVFLAIPVFVSVAGIHTSAYLSNSQAVSREVINEGDTGQETFHDYVDNNFFPCFPEEFRDDSPSWEGVTRCHQSSPNSMPTVAIVGDSHAEQLFVGLSERYPDVNFVYLIDGVPIPQTSPRMAQILNHVASDKDIRVVVLTAFWRVAGVPAIELGATARMLVESGKHVFITDDTPDFSFDPIRCKYSASLLTSSTTCRSIPEGFSEEKGGPIWYEPLATLADSLPRVTLVETYTHFCDSGFCSMSKDGKLLFRDSNHLNLNGSRYLAEVIYRDPRFARAVLSQKTSWDLLQKRQPDY